MVLGPERETDGKHQFLPNTPDSWCKFQKDQMANTNNYDQNKGLPSVFKELEHISDSLPFFKILSRYESAKLRGLCGNVGCVGQVFKWVAWVTWSKIFFTWVIIFTWVVWVKYIFVWVRNFLRWSEIFAWVNFDLLDAIILLYCNW